MKQLILLSAQKINSVSGEMDVPYDKTGSLSYANRISTGQPAPGIFQPDDCSAGGEKAGSKSRLPVAPLLLGFLGGLGRFAGARFTRCRVVDLADVVSLD
jgi:hypothetical protein